MRCSNDFGGAASFISGRTWKLDLWWLKNGKIMMGRPSWLRVCVRRSWLWLLWFVARAQTLIYDGHEKSDINWLNWTSCGGQNIPRKWETDCCLNCHIDSTHRQNKILIKRKIVTLRRTFTNQHNGSRSTSASSKWTHHWLQYYRCILFIVYFQTSNFYWKTRNRNKGKTNV